MLKDAREISEKKIDEGTCFYVFKKGKFKNKKCSSKIFGSFLCCKKHKIFDCVYKAETFLSYLLSTKKMMMFTFTIKNKTTLSINIYSHYYNILFIFANSILLILKIKKIRGSIAMKSEVDDGKREKYINKSYKKEVIYNKQTYIMEHPKPKPIERNFKDIRKLRQTGNIKTVYESLRNGDIKTVRKDINPKAYERYLEYLEITEEELLIKCKDDRLFAKSTSMNISKKSSRQGSKDETEQLRICNIIAEKCGVSIKNLNQTELRATKDGSILSKDEMKIRKISKDCCLKSFDAKISGKFSGFITAKVVYGNGGHQDNVFEEMDNIAEWWKKYKSESEDFLIILIDSDLIKKITTIKEKYSNLNNVKVFNHVEFQEYMINIYYIDESM
jgi:hypothetical protein